MHEKVWWITVAPVEYPTLSVRTPFRMLPCPSAENEPTAAARVPSTNAPAKENPYAPWMLPSPNDEPLDPEAASTMSPNANTGTDGHVLIDCAPLVSSFAALRGGHHRSRVCHVPLGHTEAGGRNTTFGPFAAGETKRANRAAGLVGAFPAATVDCRSRRAISQTPGPGLARAGGPGPGAFGRASRDGSRGRARPG